MPYADIERQREHHRQYQKSEQGKERHAAACKAWRARARKRYRAQNVLNAAIRDGKVCAWPVCAIPECDGKPEAHHADYDNPLGVTWLCDKHHKECHMLAKTL